MMSNLLIIVTVVTILAVAANGQPPDIAKLTALASNPKNYEFGNAVSIDLNWGAVGQIGPPEIGYILFRNATGPDGWGVWQQVTAWDGVTSGGFGLSVSLNDTLAAFGAPTATAVYVFSKNATNYWASEVKLTATPAVASSGFGTSVGISFEYIAVGAPNAGGAVYVFKETSGSWSQQAMLASIGMQATDLFGSSVSISGSLLLAGAYGRATKTGSAYVFQNSGGTWAQVAMLTANDAVSSDWFGYSVAISGDIAVIGAPQKSSNIGAAYVYSSPSWGQLRKLVPAMMMLSVVALITVGQ